MLSLFLLLLSWYFYKPRRCRRASFESLLTASIFSPFSYARFSLCIGFHSLISSSFPSSALYESETIPFRF